MSDTPIDKDVVENDKLYLMALGGCSLRSSSIFTDDTGELLVEEFWQIASRVHGPPACRIHGTGPYKYLGYSHPDAQRSSPYTARDILSVIDKARKDAIPIKDLELMTPNMAKLAIKQTSTQRNEQIKSTSSQVARGVGDSGSEPLWACGQETIGEALDGLAITLNIVAKIIVERITK